MGWDMVRYVEDNISFEAAALMTEAYDKGRMDSIGEVAGG